MAATDFLIKEKDEQIQALVNALSISMADPLPHPSKDTPQRPNPNTPPSSPWGPGQSPAPSKDDKLAHHIQQKLQIGPGQPSNPWDTYGPLPPIPNPAGEGWGEPAQPPGGHEQYELQPGWWRNDMQISQYNPNDPTPKMYRVTEKDKEQNTKAYQLLMEGNPNYFWNPIKPERV